MSTTQTPTLTRAAFAAWLAPKADEEVVGTAQNPCTCPLATFLESLPNVDEAYVSDRYYLITTRETDAPSYFNEVRRSLPTWAQAFVERVDDWLDDDTVTAGTAREYLARIPDEGEAAS